MTTLAISPRPLRRLFSLIDFAPRPNSDDLLRLLEYWREKRGQHVAPTRDEISEVEIGAASSHMFLYELSEVPRTYRLGVGLEATRELLGDLKIGDDLTQARNRRIAVRLRRLFDFAREAGEPVLVEFAMQKDGQQFLTEILAAPVAASGRSREAIFGGAAVRPLDGMHRAPRHTATRGNRPPVLFALGDSTSLGEAVARHLDVPVAPHEERDFEDGEHKVRSLANIRGDDVYVLANLAGDGRASANDRLCKLLFFVGTLKDAGAGRVTAVVPYLCYSRKDRQTKSRDPVTTRYVAQLFEAVKTDHVITLEVHNLAAFQNAFRCDTDHLDADSLFAEHFAAIVGDAPVAVASPDVGGVKRAERFRERLEAMLGRPVGKAFMDKQRSMGKVTGDIFAGDVSGSSVIILDDMISTGTTMARMAIACRERGAQTVYVAATHGVFSGGAQAIVDERRVDAIVVTDSISPLRLDRKGLGDRLIVLSVANLLAEAIARIHAGGSIVELLERGV
jgi:ribose-phosphate pyrophosphokinase